MRWPLIALFAVCGWGAYDAYVTRARYRPPGQIAVDAPVQRDIENGTPFTVGRFALTPRANFSTTARIIAKERYRIDSGAALMPLDLGIGWGQMSDSDLLDQMKLSQSGRFLRWSADKQPSVSWDDINRSAANLHVIPANDSVANRLYGARVGDIVDLEGDLVDARRSDGWFIKTSLTRDDTGAGACEVIYVRSVNIRR